MKISSHGNAQAWKKSLIVYFRAKELPCYQIANIARVDEGTITQQVRMKALDSAILADAAAIQTAIVLFAVHLIYTLSLLQLLSFQVFFSTLLGYTALLYCHHISSAAGKNSVNIKCFHIDQDWERGSIC